MNAIIFTAVWGILMMFGAVFCRQEKGLFSPKGAKVWALIGITGALLLNGTELYLQESFFDIDVKNMLHFNSFNLTFISAMFFCSLIYFMLNGKEIEQVGSNIYEYFALIFFVLCGVCLAATFNTLLLLFLGIEIITIPVYILTGSDKRNLKSNEAALKYFLMGAFSTGIMLMGIAFIYGGNSTGSFYIDQINLGGEKLSAFLTIGLLFLLIALSFKVSAAPFHFWTPDAYDGAPTVFTSFMSTIVKAAAFFAFIRLFENSFGNAHLQWQKLIAIITALTLFIGNITAVFQQSVKRMLAYSSIAQAGFMLLAVFALNENAKEGLIFYSVAYSLATIGIFAVLTKMNDFTIDGFNGLAKHQPVVAVTATVFLLSLTGVPLTAGFLSKFYMLMAAVKDGHQSWLVIFAVLCAAISAYYYFKIIQAMFFKEPAELAEGQSMTKAISESDKYLLCLVALLILVMGIMPGLVTDWAHYYK